MARERGRHDDSGGIAPERIQEVLDGDLPPEALTADERHELGAYERAAAEVLASLPREAPPRLAGGVMTRVREVARARAAQALAQERAHAGALRLPAGERLGDGVIAHEGDQDDDGPGAAGPRRPRPTWLAAARLTLVRAARELRQATAWCWAPRPISLTFRPAYALGVAAALAVLLVAPTQRIREPQPEAQARVFVHFRLDAPGAHQVALAGDFTGWQPTYELHEGAPGVWSVAVPLAPGVHDYVFVVDGRRWVPDPLAPPIADGFGGSNSRVSVLPPLLGKES